MAMLDGFNANNVQPAEAWTPVPQGTYTVMITESSREKTKSGTGEYLKLVFRICGGEQNNRPITARLNIWNQSEQARVIAQSELSAICHAVGVMVPNDSLALHNTQMLADVTVRQDGDKFFNDIKNFRALSAPAPTAPTAPANTNPNMSWAR